MNRVTIQHSPSAPATRPQARIFAAVEALLGLASTLETSRRERKARMQFSRIDARTLRDAGISEAQRFLLSQP